MLSTPLCEINKTWCLLNIYWVKQPTISQVTDLVHPIKNVQHIWRKDGDHTSGYVLVFGSWRVQNWKQNTRNTRKLSSWLWEWVGPSWIIRSMGLIYLRIHEWLISYWGPMASSFLKLPVSSVFFLNKAISPKKDVPQETLDILRLERIITLSSSPIYHFN